jgi:hypothetical protein
MDHGMTWQMFTCLSSASYWSADAVWRTPAGSTASLPYEYVREHSSIITYVFSNIIDILNDNLKINKLVDTKYIYWNLSYRDLSVSCVH